MATTLEQAKAERDSCQTKVNELHARRSELAGGLEEIADSIRAGSPARAGEVAAIAEEKAETDSALQKADTEFAAAEQQFQEALRASRVQRWATVIKECRERRARFAQLYREACLEFGNIVHLRDEAGQLFNQLITQHGPIENPIFYQYPNSKNELTEINSELVSIEDLCSGLDGLSRNMHTGYGMQVAIVPLHPKRGK